LYLESFLGAKEDQPPKLTSENETSYRKEIPLGVLTKTYLDAIKVVQELGFAFIWIDSL
jgi:hypothetical protein